MVDITLVQRVLPHYRIPFMLRLHETLKARGIAFTLIYGQERQGTVPPTIPLHEPWAKRIVNTYASIGPLELVWQGCLRDLTSDLVIVEQSNRLLINYPLQLTRLWSKRQLAFWGHGKNLQSRGRTARESIKRRLTKWVDWWFAYTEISREAVIAAGYPPSRITVVNNSIDDTLLRAALGAISARSKVAVATSLGIRGRHPAIFVGSLHAEKRLEFLITAAKAIRARVPDFELMIVGDGPMRDYILEASGTDQWIRYVGHLTGAELVPYLYSAKILMMPGLVGLVVVDSFVAECPLVTTSYPYHSPEISYLKNGYNGVVTDNNLDSYINNAVQLLTDDKLLNQLRIGCRESASRYSLNQMVTNFADGIENCLALR